MSTQGWTVEWSESNPTCWTIEISQQWYEVWADESLATPYILLVVPDERMAGGVIVLDSREGLKVVHAAPSYENAKDLLLEDEYTRVEGRMERDE